MLKVKVPEELPMGAHRYKTYLSEWAEKHDRSGAVVHDKLQIFIAPGAEPSVLMESYSHELVHIIGRVFCVHLDEREVDSLAEGLTQFLRDGLGIEFDWSNIETIKANLPIAVDKLPTRRSPISSAEAKQAARAAIAKRTAGTT